MITSDTNFRGNFDSIEAVWEAIPYGGVEGDYLNIQRVKYRWNKYLAMWENAEVVTETPARETVTFDEDVNMQNNLTVAGVLRAKEIVAERFRVWNPKGNYDATKVYSINDLVYDTNTKAAYLSMRSNNIGHPVDENDESYEEGWWMEVQTIGVPKGDFSLSSSYNVGDIVYDSDTNSSYMSLRADNMGHAVTDEEWWMKVVDGSYVNLLEEELQQLVDSISEGTQQQVEELNEALEALEAQADQSRQDIQDIVDSLAVVQTTGQSASDVMSQKAVTDSLVSNVITYDNSQSSLAAENVQEALDEMAGLPSETITAADMIVGKNGFLINVQTWMSQNTFGYRILKIDGKKGVLSVSANTDVSIFAILNTLNEAKANSALGTFANGYTERVVLTANTTETYALDGSCNFVIFNYKLSEDNVFPLSISFKESAQDAVENSEEAITSLEDKVTISEQVGYSDMSVVSDTYNIGETTWSKTTNTIGTMVYNVPNEYKGGRLKVIANSTGSWFAMMNTYTTPSNGQSLGVFAEGYTGRTMMGAAVTGTYEIPHDCNYILFTYQRTNDSIFPFRIKLERDIKDFVGNDVTSVPISDSDLMQGVGNYIINTNTWLSNNNFGYKILDMSHFVGSIRVTSNTDVSIFAILNTLNEAKANSALGTFANGYTGRIVQDANTTEEYYVDGSCNYAIFNYKIVNDNVFPVSIELVSSSGEIAKRNSSEIQKLKREGADEMIATQVMRNAMCLSPTNYKFAFGAFVFMKDGNAYISYFTDVNPNSDRPNLQGHDMFMAEVNLADNSIQNHNENVTSVLDNEGNVLAGYRGGDLKSPLVIGNKIYVLQQIYKDNQANPYAAYTIWDEPSEYWTGYSVRCATLEYTDTNNVSHSVIFSLANFRQMVVDMGWVNTYYQPGYDMFDDCAIAYDSNTSKFYKVMCTVNENFGGIPLVVLESSDFATWTVIGTVGSGKYKSSEISIAIKDSKIYISARTLTTVLWFVYDIANGIILENGEFNVGGVLSRPYTLIYNNDVYMAINVFPTVYGTMENYHSRDLDCRPEVNLYKFVDDKPILFRVINNPTGINYHAWCETPPLICEGQTLPITAQSGIYCAYSEDRRRIFRRQFSQVSFADVTALFAENEKIV